MESDGPSGQPITITIDDFGRYIYFVIVTSRQENLRVADSTEDSGFAEASAIITKEMKSDPNKHPWVPPPAKTSRNVSKQEYSRSEERCHEKGHIQLDDSSSEFSAKIESIHKEIRNLKKRVYREEIDGEQTGSRASGRETYISEIKISASGTTEVNEQTEFDSEASKVRNVFSSTISLTKEVIAQIKNLRCFVRKLDPKSEEYPADVRFVDFSKGKLLRVVTQLAEQNAELRRLLESVTVDKEIDDKASQLDYCINTLKREIFFLNASQDEIGLDVSEEDEPIGNGSVEASTTANLTQRRHSFSGASVITVRDGDLTSQGHEDYVQQIKTLQRMLDEANGKIIEMNSRISAGEAEKETLRHAVVIQKSQAEMREKKFQQRIDIEEEFSEMKETVGTLNLQLAKLNSENDRLEIDNNTLEIKLHEAELNLEKNGILTSELKILLDNTKTDLATSKEENSRFKELLRSAEIELDNLKCENESHAEEISNFYIQKEHAFEKRESELRREIYEQFQRSSRNLVVDKATQTTFETATSVTARDFFEVRIRDEQMSEILSHRVKTEDDFAVIIRKLQEFEQKLERSQVINEKLTVEMRTKDSQLMETMSNYKAVKEENASLRRQLDSACAEAQKYSSDTKSTALTLEKEMQMKLCELEVYVASLRHENKTLKKEKEEVEKRQLSEIAGIQRRFEEQQICNRKLQDYIVFLRNSYASIVDRQDVHGLH